MQQEGSSGPSLVRVHFKTTTDADSFQMSVTSVKKCCVAYKVHMTNPSKYHVSPPRGIIQPAQTAIINFEARPQQAHQPCQSSLTVLVWPAQMNSFDDNLWKSLQVSTKADTQKINVEMARGDPRAGASRQAAAPHVSHGQAPFLAGPGMGPGYRHESTLPAYQVTPVQVRQVTHITSLEAQPRLIIDPQNAGPRTVEVPRFKNLNEMHHGGIQTDPAGQDADHQGGYQAGPPVAQSAPRHLQPQAPSPGRENPEHHHHYYPPPPPPQTQARPPPSPPVQVPHVEENAPVYANPDRHLDEPTQISQMVTVYPSKLTYRPPYGMKKQVDRINITSISTKTLAFKIKAEDSTWRFFEATCTRGVMQPSTSKTIEIQMKDDFNHPDVLDKELTFSLFVIPWLKPIKEFDGEVWKAFEEMVKPAPPFVIQVSLDRTQNVIYIYQDDAKQSQPPPRKVVEVAEKKQQEPEEAVPHDADDQPMVFKTDPAKAKGKGPPLVQVKPTSVLFKKCSLKTPHLQFEVTATSLSTKPVAFQVQTNKRQFYLVKPTKGILQPKATQTLHFEHFKKVTPEQVMQDPKPPAFQINIFKWPNSMTTFDDALWKEYNTSKHNEKQRILIDVDFEGKKYPPADADDHPQDQQPPQ